MIMLFLLTTKLLLSYGNGLTHIF